MNIMILTFYFFSLMSMTCVPGLFGAMKSTEIISKQTGGILREARKIIRRGSDDPVAEFLTKVERHLEGCSIAGIAETIKSSSQVKTCIFDIADWYKDIEEQTGALRRCYPGTAFFYTPLKDIVEAVIPSIKDIKDLSAKIQRKVVEKESVEAEQVALMECLAKLVKSLNKTTLITKTFCTSLTEHFSSRIQEYQVYFWKYPEVRGKLQEPNVLLDTINKINLFNDVMIGVQSRSKYFEFDAGDQAKFKVDKQEIGLSDKETDDLEAAMLTGCIVGIAVCLFDVICTGGVGTIGGALIGSAGVGSGSAGFFGKTIPRSIANWLKNHNACTLAFDSLLLAAQLTATKHIFRLCREVNVKLDAVNSFIVTQEAIMPGQIKNLQRKFENGIKAFEEEQRKRRDVENMMLAFYQKNPNLFDGIPLTGEFQELSNALQLKEHKMKDYSGGSSSSSSSSSSSGSSFTSSFSTTSMSPSLYTYESTSKSYLSEFQGKGTLEEKRKESFKEENQVQSEVLEKTGQADLWEVLCYAIDSNEPGKVAACLEKDRTLLTRTIDGLDYTPLHYACDQRRTNIVQLLCAKYRADVHVTTPDGKTALHIVAQRGFVDCAELLVKYGADKEVVDEDGYTPLHYAAQKGYQKLIPFLATPKIIDQRTKSSRIRGSTALEYALQEGHYPMVLALLAVKASTVGTSLNMQNKHGSTILHAAARKGDSEGIKLLLEAGASIMVSDKDSRTPYDVALLHRHESTAALLKEEVGAESFLFVEKD